MMRPCCPCMAKQGSATAGAIEKKDNITQDQDLVAGTPGELAIY